MADINAGLSLITTEKATSHLPMWAEWGVRDASHLIHSLGCTFLTAIGREAGFASVSEVPAPREGVLEGVEEDVRSDSVWFNRTTRSVDLIAEFERYAGQQKDLSPKIESLLLAQQRWGNENAVLVLAYWTIGYVTLPDHQELKAITRAGYRAAGGQRVPGNLLSRVLFYQFVMSEAPGGKLHLSAIFQRGVS